MNHIKDFFKQKGLYFFCLALVFAATVAGILAVRSVVGSISELARIRKEALEDSTWEQPDTAVNNPASDVPEETSTPSPAPSASPSASPAPSESEAVSSAPAAAAGSSDASAASSSLWRSEVLAAFSGEELVYNETLADWRTHNGADYAADTGAEVCPVAAGTVTAVSQDALWGWVVEVTETDGTLRRYCGLNEPTVAVEQAVTTATALGTVGEIPAEAHLPAHIHLECIRNGAYQDPA